MKLDNVEYKEKWIDCIEDPWYLRLKYAFLLITVKKVKYYSKREKLPPGKSNI